MGVSGLQPDPDITCEPLENWPEIIDRYIAGEISLEEFVALLEKDAA